ncbi:nitrite reductase (NAD(P)H) small subunit [Alkalilimnicola ehrlichii]|uniref:Nitrite reductase (NAD(P)H) small subunit n=1 Tax=Alkalilimnicola ehrlichii TaxID=351052 RepID=A0A3E0WM41_9GAMM|nr:nitrite reductase small subunit NirD [Alkalilimnicola ehrlichii]RFA26784.1 nitrite reductase (NAD(P)H) small subunit [Alkalilimnicola ehrlichii]RFA33878.1 nitrite reductase (NAD(P)H) small subunit [Alkalilimnicola ehrlichii]
MSQANAVRMSSAQLAPQPGPWQVLCSRDDLVANSGVVAWFDGAQVALFYLPETEQGEQVFAIENRDPKSGANVIGRGIVGRIKDEYVIAAPLYKQHFSLEDGRCLEDSEQYLRVWSARLNGDLVEIAA